MEQQPLTPVNPAVVEDRPRKKTMRRVLFVVPPLLFAMVLSVGLLLYSSASDATKKVSLGWSPATLVTESLAPGESATYIVSMTNLGKSSIGPKNQLQIVAEGDIASYITIRQPEFPKGAFRSGDSVSFAVTVAVPVDAPPVGATEGKLFLSRVQANKMVKKYVWREDGLTVLRKDKSGAIWVKDPETGIYPVNEVRLRVVAGTTPEDVQELAGLVDGEILDSIPQFNMYLLRLPTHTIADLNVAIELLENDPRVKHATTENLPGLTAAPSDLTQLSYLNPEYIHAYDAIKVRQAWELILSQLPESHPLSHVSVAIIDTGVDGTHPEFAGVNLLGKRTEDGGYTISGQYLPSHGTSVAGIIGANNTLAPPYLYQDFQMNGILSGITNNYTLASAPITSGFFEELNMVMALTSSPINARIINMSYGHPLCGEVPTGYDCMSLEQFTKLADDYRMLFNYYNDDVLFVAGAGNNKIKAGYNLPGGGVIVDNLITVAGTIVPATTFDESAVTGPVEWISLPNSWGTNVWGNLFWEDGMWQGSVDEWKGIDIAAPAEKVYAPHAYNSVPPELQLSDYEWPDCGLLWCDGSAFGGTSASAPMVTGVASMLKAVNDKLTPKQIKDIITQTATPVCVPGEARDCFLNAQVAVARVLALNKPLTFDLLAGEIEQLSYDPADGDGTTGTYNNIRYRFKAVNNGAQTIAVGEYLPYKITVESDPGHVSPSLLRKSLDSGVDYWVGGLISGGDFTYLTEEFDGVPFGENKVTGRVNLDGATLPYSDTNPDNNKVEGTFFLPVPQPPMSIFGATTPYLVRSGETATIKWSVEAHYPSLTCEVTGPAFVKETFKPVDQAIGPKTGQKATGPLTSSGTYRLICTESITNTVFTKTMRVEVIPTVGET